MPEDKNKHLRSDDDSQLFRESIGEVKVLRNNKSDPLSVKPKPKPVKKDFQLTLPPTTFHQPTNSIQSDDLLFFSRDGIQHKTIKRLKRGAISIDEKLDLHGLTAQQASQYLTTFLAEQIIQKSRCVLVVHGKGIGSANQQPVLKNLAFNFLKNESSVLALTSAQQRDGGTGALYVLLKKSN
ncbi:MAG: DNA mismatch repair protein MutS [Cycloclasticus sp. symbiont of Bathymodiolus heckerae]|nr:MAG: DNA mismatch repair protein MutS [Cycloclasticus sp. symbiont of Bathymodiolus heckerae]